MVKSFASVWVLMGLLMATSCADPVGKGQSGWLSASLQGTVTGSYQGSGDFHDQTNRSQGPRRMFSLSSRSHDPANAASFSFYRHNGTRPTVGRYEMKFIDQRDTQAEGFFAVYMRVTDVAVELFMTDSGEVNITRSSRDRVEGTFRFVGFRYCAQARSGPYWQEGSCNPTTPPSGDEPTIEITGSFSAVPNNEEMLDMIEVTVR